MRKHSVRKWIHAICDLLPLLVIPIFALAVRSDNNYQPIEVQQENTEVVNFNQLYDVDLSTTTSDYTFIGNGQYFDCTFNNSSYYEAFYLSYDLIEDHKYYLRVSDYQYSTNVAVSIRYLITTNGSISYNQSTYHNIFTYPYNSNRFALMFDARDVYYSGGYPVRVSGYFNLFDLTLMFGLGNEPTYQQFDIWYPNNFYSYDTGTKQLLHTGTFDTFNDTDVGSQMVYTLYNTCDKYFNFNNVGVFQDLYTWFETNMFNGTAPMSFYIVWNVILFEFIMDLIFLTYMVFMFIIDFTECMIDRFFEKSYRGGR